jgi:hypothetical protein
MRNYTIYIDENECIGDSLDTFNVNFETLDTATYTLSSQNILLKSRYNTLLQTLSSTYTSLTALVIP